MKSRPEITRKLILSHSEGILLEVDDLAACKTLCSANLLGFRVVFSLIQLLRFSALFSRDRANCREVNIGTHEGGDKYMSASRNQSEAIVWPGICLTN